MTVTQLYNTIIAITENRIEGATNVIDHSSFVKFGEDILSSATNKDMWFSTLVDRIGKTVFAIRTYQAKNRNILVDSFTFGSILQKISYRLNEAEESPEWKVNGENPYSWTRKEGIIQKLFAQDLTPFSYKDVIPDYQLESAFTSESAMSGFINGLYTRMYNAMEVSIEGMNDEAIASFVTEVFKEATDTDEPINSRRARNLFAEYNASHTPIATVDEALESKDFLEFACVEMGTVIPFMEKLTTMYNDGSVERFTNKDNLVVEVNSIFEKKYDVYLKSNTFHNDLVSLPNFSSVPYWNNPTTPLDIKSNDGTTTTTVPNVIAIFRDKDSVVTTLDREDYATMYDSINRRTYVRLSANRRYIADTSENCVIFYLDATVSA